MKKLWIMALLVSGGCGATADIAAPEAARGKHIAADFAGVYVGQDTCTTTAALNNQVVGVGTESFLVTTTFSASGIPQIQSIERMGVEAVQLQTDRFTTTCTTTDVNVGDHSIVIREECDQVVDGTDSCASASDGVCDEPMNCAWSTDFSDCGPLQWDLEKTTTYSFPFDGVAFRTVSQVLIEPNTGDEAMASTCSGELLRQPTPE